ncbi:MAG: SpoIIE family protein phosphatase [Candidatus Marinimicrobia bacterium]|nr:SpoIIE family protein phosphatase [Candidatus Neomarinimicrobiota bacterium]MCK9559272.1 SpoIIE family protein phosphatase [Candidatus Neomarinimicrobiota bacterium]MDD5061565.1 SpoIIE family protein phosphatase [Candidatus Neomarinimicrobiota bacterium]MDD5231484.1 SpoIIE family protein phosphatase [Candidatus Neomarinimicrobiota bacterium]MDD5540710.1 SpoIIE family protein phosphatase [Candidatus Neomarinimicrobiota bacterium]
MPERIMVVDDEPDLESLIRQRFRRQIRDGEYDFVFAYNGLEALSRLLEFPDINLILSDINMPEMDGLTLLAKLNELKNPNLKTVIVSAYGDMDNIRTAMNRGAFDFVTKPVDFTDLETTINKTIRELQILRQAQQEHDQLLAIQHDLTIARNIQQSILPKVFPPFPERNDFDIYAGMTPAKEVGGDFYDFFLIDKDRLGLVIGDVSGKGIPAAIFMAVSRTLLKATALKGLPTGECLSYVNELICLESTASMFVTIFYGIFNTTTGELEYANGGHNPPYLLKADGSVQLLEMTNGMALGVMEELDYQMKSIALHSGDGLFLYTDGVTEAFNAAGQIYTDERLAKLLAGSNTHPIKEIVQKVFQDVHEYSTGIEQSDDITILAMRRSAD